MRIPPGIRRAFRLPVTSDRIVRDLDDEVRLHVDMRAAALAARGLSPEHAEAEARRRFGDVEDLRDYCVSIEVAHMQRVELSERMSGVFKDLHFAARQIHKAPGFTTIAALTLALGIGATTSIFSVVNEVVLRPLPYPRADRIMQLWEATKSSNQVAFADPNFWDMEKLNKSFSSMASYENYGVSVVSNGEPLRAMIDIISPRFFDVLDAKPIAGRFFLPDEQQGASTTPVVISYGFWQRQFGGARSAIGSSLTADSRTVIVVGVLPPDMDFPSGTDIYVPRDGKKGTSRTAHNWRVIARLKDGVSTDQAQQDVSTIFRQLKSQFGGYTDASDGAVVSLQDQIAGPIKPMLMLLLATSGLLLLIACANVVNLLVVRMAARENELAIRVAIGAGRSRLVQQLLLEASVLAMIGCAGGLLLAFAGVKTLAVLRPPNIPGVEHIDIDWRVLVFALAVSAATAIALGLIAAWRGARGDLRSALSHGGRTQGGGGASDRIRGMLVIVQVAMTVVLLVGAGLLGRSFMRVLSIDPGYRTRQLVVASILYPGQSGPADLARRVQFYDDALARARTIPGVTSAGGANGMPLSPGGGDGTFLILSSADEKIEPKDFERLFQDKSRTGYADYRVASGDYFKTMNIPLISGRTFNDGDRPGGQEVAVISASLAKKRWPNENPIGKVIEFGNMDGDLAPITIVGVVGDVHEETLASNPESVFYVFYRQRPAHASEFRVVMATSTPASVMTEARSMFHQLRSDVPVSFTTIEEMVGRSMSQQRFMLLLIGVFGAVALVLATLGVYSVISYLVEQRRHELSIRVALGARSADIVQMVLRQGMTLAVTGTMVGAAVALVATRALKQLLYEISPTDPVAFAGVIILLIVVALAASFLPAKRAGNTAPMNVLRGG